MRIMIRHSGNESIVEHREGPLEIGRGPKRDAARVIVADPCVSKDQFRIERGASGAVTIENISQRVAATLGDGRRLDCGARLTADLPSRIHVGETIVEISSGDPSGTITREKLNTIQRPVRRSEPSVVLPIASLGESPSPEILAGWFENFLGVLRAASSNTEFYREAAQAAVLTVGLDFGVVLLRSGDGWQVAATHLVDPAANVDISHTILDYVVAERCTFYQSLDTLDATPSLSGVQAVVASPIMDDSGENVAGAIYGVKTRARPGEPAIAVIKKIEAQVMQLLAAAVGAGRARQRSEDEAQRRAIQFEQFFSQELARELDKDASLLSGREAEITVLFSDIRNFTKISQLLHPAEACELVHDVMETLTARIAEFDGVVVDYVGDGLVAMWNAPQKQADHAQLACRAAIAMTKDMPLVTARWEKKLSMKLAVGIGLNTGTALVGNIGSKRKFKYGPLGHTVNLASRVEGATKQLGVGIILTGSTAQHLESTGFARRRIGNFTFVGVDTPTALYELVDVETSDEWRSIQEMYESALKLFEAGEWAASCKTIYPLLQKSRGDYDVPALTLLGRAIELLRTRPVKFDPTFTLTTK